MRIRILWPVLGPVLALAAAGCDRFAPEPEAAGSAAPATVASPKAAPPPPLAETPGEIPIGEMTGIWRVAGVVPDKGSEFVADDPRINGSLLDITTEHIRWSYKASPSFRADDLCMGTVAGLIDDGDYADKTRQMLAPAVADSRTAKARLSQPHQFLCADGGDWGNETEFQRIADDRMVMRWDGGVTLVLDRVRKIDEDPVPLAPTGAYEAN